MEIDVLMHMYKNCKESYDKAISLKIPLDRYKIDTDDLVSAAKKIKEIGMAEINKYKIINKKDLTQMSIIEYYDNFDVAEYSEHIDCDDCHFETCLACVANLLEDLYNFNDDFIAEFDKNYSIIKLADNKEK